MRRGSVAVIIPVAVLAVCLSPGALVRWKIEKSVVEKAPSLLGPARSYSADVTGGVLDLVRGRVPQIRLRGNDVQLKNGIVVDRLDVILSGVKFKLDQTITGIDSAEFTASLSQENLRDYLRKSRSDMTDAEVELGDGKLVLSAKPRVIGIKTPVLLEGTMEIVDGTKLNMVLSKLTARGIRVPGFVRGRIQHDINPVMDTTQMGMQAKLTKVAIKKGEITLSGTADVNQILVAK